MVGVVVVVVVVVVCVVAVAVVWVVVVTVVVCVPPLDTLRRTVEPGLTLVPGLGLWAMTVPTGGSTAPGRLRLEPGVVSWDTASASLRLTVFGTATAFAPFETVSVTTPPVSICVPAPGDCANTTPDGSS